MNKLSNKGQSLTLFLVFLPVLILLGCFVIDLGYAKYNDLRLEETTKTVLRYGLKHIDEDVYPSMVDLLYKNDDTIDEYKIDIKTEEKEIFISVSKASKGLFGKVINKNVYKEKSKFKGYIKEDKIIIERDED